MSEIEECQCLRCVIEREGLAVALERMFLCPICGNKRCPRSDDHRNRCDGSNSPGQEGSRYADVEKP